MVDIIAQPPAHRQRLWRVPTGMKRLLWTLASITMTVILWSAFIFVAHPPNYLLPAPWDVLATIWVDREILIYHGATTISEILIGIVLGGVIAVPLGTTIVAIPIAERLFYPIAVAFNSIPKIALAPLFVVWFGYGFMPRVLLTASITFFPILVSTVSGLIAIDPELLKLATVLRAKRSRVFLRMRLPYALPSIFSGIKVATSLGVIGAISAEFVSSDRGWGYLLVQSSGTLDTALMFSVIIILAVVASLLFSIANLIEGYFVFWHASHRQSLR
jgi:NitT/TauT family transport system permease protein